MSFRLRPEAEADIEGIALYIAADNPIAARNWFNDLYLGSFAGEGEILR